jgi:uncharacterized protein
VEVQDLSGEARLSGDRRLPSLAAGRAASYGYECRACTRCCYGKRIQVNPYEVARLARHRGVSTTELIARCTVEGGIALANREDGSCVFLEERGCGVHADRPLACRLYPLGRIAGADGSERFVHLEAHPRSEGEVHDRGRVADYLRTQEVEPYLRAADAYREVLDAMLDVLSRDERPEPGTAAAGAESGHGGLGAADYLDMDRAVGVRCRVEGAGSSSDPEAKLSLHLDTLREWIRKIRESRGAPAA